MLFSSIPFLYYFLPLVLIIYFAVPFKFKNFVLLIASLIFYAWGEPRYVVIMVVSVLIGFILGIQIEKFRGRTLGKALTALSVVICLGFLLYFKYVDFFIESFNSAFGLSIPLLKVALPIGISFYTFQILSYTIDVYRGDTKAQKNIITLGAYIAMFPQLIAGPIVRYSDVAFQLTERKHSFEKASKGIRRFIIGLSKKVLIANTLGQYCNLFTNTASPSVLYSWLYAASFALQIYYDFSGYSDMAIGLGHILGFDFIENFNYPFISRSVTEFWRRWHMSLGSWFRDYLYIPLGGNRVSKPRFIFNIFVVWMTTGFWHGADWNFIFWGLYFAVLLLIEKFFLLKLLKKNAVISHIYTIFVVLISFVIFNATDMNIAVMQLSSMFKTIDVPFVNSETLFFAGSYLVLLVLAVIGATPIVKNIFTKIKSHKAFVVLEPIFLAVMLIIVTASLVSGSFNPFLYFRF